MTTDTCEFLSQLETVDLGAVREIGEGVLSEGFTFGDFTQITDDEMEAAYACGFQLLNQQQPAQAEQLFRFLISLNHYEVRFWMGLGAAQQLQGKHEEANTAFSWLWQMDYENPVPPLRAAECLVAMNRWEEADGAAIAAEAAAERAGDDVVAHRARLIQSQVAAHAA